MNGLKITSKLTRLGTTRYNLWKHENIVGSIERYSDVRNKSHSISRIVDLRVDEKYQGLGYGRLLIDCIEAEMKKDGCYFIEVTSSKSAIGFYEKCGFRLHNGQVARWWNELEVGATHYRKIE